jgi:hypothetical protein
MAAKIETSERQLADAAADSDHKVDEQLLASFKEFQSTSVQSKPVKQLSGSPKNFQRTSHQSKPAEDLHNLILGISPHFDKEPAARKTVYDRLLSIENQTKRRGSRGFARYLVAICIGVAATLAWQSYGELVRQVIATRAPELGWSPEAKRMIARWVEQLGWTKPLAGAESTAVRSSVPETPQAASVAQTAPEADAPKAPAAFSIDPEQVHQIALDLTALRQTVEQLAAGQQRRF